MAAARAAVKLGSFVRDEAICSTRNLWISGDSVLGFEAVLLLLLLLLLLLIGESMGDFDLVRSRVMVGPDELSEVEQGTDPMAMHLLEPDVSSI